MPKITNISDKIAEIISPQLEEIKNNTPEITRPKMIAQIKPRGLKAMLPHGGLPELISPHLQRLIEETGGEKGPVGLQFVAQMDMEHRYNKKNLDPLIEDHNEIAPGVVYKYRGRINIHGEVVTHGRILWTITRFCASYCRFCTRGREVGIMPSLKACTKGAIANKTLLSDEDIQKVFQLIRNRREINEVILSGGDPLTTPKEYFEKITNGLAELQQEGHLDIIRIGTRLPIHNPEVIKDWHYTQLAKIKNPNLMVHINHPAELTPQTLEVLNNFRRYSLATVFSQTVLLKGVNDSVETLHKLFTTLVREGIRPYYVFQNDPVYWARHFTVPVKKAIKLWGNLRSRLSGLAATARFVIDVPFGYGKVPIPEGNAWNVDFSHFFDFKKKRHQMK